MSVLAVRPDVPETRMLAYFGHHKCATQWMNRVVGLMCKEIGMTPVTFNSRKAFGGDLDAAVTDRGSTFVCYLNAEFPVIRRIKRLRAVHMVRDPRDIVVSAYFSHLNTHPTDGWPELVEQRARLQSMSKHDGLRAMIDDRATQFRIMQRWDYDRRNILEVRMEDATTDAERVLTDIAKHLYIKRAGMLTDAAIATIADKTSFAHLAGRKPGTEDQSSHYRRGVHGDWRNHLADEHIAVFKQRYNDLLVQLGYEQDDSWGH